MFQSVTADQLLADEIQSRTAIPHRNHSLALLGNCDFFLALGSQLPVCRFLRFSWLFLAFLGFSWLFRPSFRTLVTGSGPATLHGFFFRLATDSVHECPASLSPRWIQKKGRANGVRFFAGRRGCSSG